MNKYKRDDMANWGRSVANNNVWKVKIGRSKVQAAENVLAYSRQVGQIQRKFGLTKDQYLVNNEDAYRKLLQSSKVNEGGRAVNFGRNTQLEFMFGQARRDANLRRAGVQQTENLKGASRQLLAMQNRTLTQRGLPPVPGLPPAKPVFPGPLEYLANNAMLLVGVASGVQGIGQSAGLKGGFWGPG